MIVCSCNRLSDRDVRGCCNSAEGPPDRVREVYARLGCAPRCGRCVSTLSAILKDAREHGCACAPGDCECLARVEAARAQGGRQAA